MMIMMRLSSSANSFGFLRQTVLNIRGSVKYLDHHLSSSFVLNNHHHRSFSSSTPYSCSSSSPPQASPTRQLNTRPTIIPITQDKHRNYKTMTGSCANFNDKDAIDTLFLRNSAWADKLKNDRPELFESLAHTQKPQILWFGCSDSRVPETSLLDLLPGEVFVHRNIANVLPYNDLSSLSVLQYAVEVLKVKHIIVCGHYGCGGVAAALGDKKLGLLDLWLKNIRDVRARHMKELQSIADPVSKTRRLVELNTIAQIHSLKRNTNVLEAIKERGLQVHAFVYDVADGKARRLEVPSDEAAADVFDLH